MAGFSQIKFKGWLATAGHFGLALAYVGMGLSHIVPLSMACMALAGWAGVTLYANTNTIIQLLVPNELRGRVISTYLWATQGTAPFGSLLIGGLAQGMGSLICRAYWRRRGLGDGRSHQPVHKPHPQRANLDLAQK
ncbi:MAG: MFS transporter [Dermatophilaceae bacterium]